MNLQLLIFACFIVLHYLADFILQTHTMASRKSFDNLALAQHVMVYLACFGVFSIMIFGEQALLPCCILAVAHFATDWLTSRWSSSLWKSQQWHLFFVVIGLDQLIHYGQLVALTIYLTH